jgi:hypothetical protein
MATMLEEYTTEEQSSVVHCFVGKRFPVYGGKCLSHRAVHNWVKKFLQGRWKIADDDLPDRPVEIATEATVQQVEELI